MHIYSVLLVEDDDRLANEFKMLIKDYPFLKLVGHAKTQTKAAKLLAELRPEVLICDLMLEEGDGLTLLTELKNSLTPWPNHVVVTSAVGNNAKISASLISMDVFIIIKDMNYSSSKVLNYLKSLFFNDMSKIETEEQKVRRAILKFLEQFSLDDAPPQDKFRLEAILAEIILNQPSDKKLNMSAVKRNLQERLPEQNFHYVTIERFLETIFDSTSIETLQTISYQFSKAAPTEKEFFSIAVKEIKKMLAE